MTSELSESHLYDVAIIGGGPAGLMAAVWLARYLHDVVVVDSGDPRNWPTRGIHGFLGQPDVTPAQLRKIGRDECRKYSVELVDDYVEDVHKLGEELFVLNSKNNGDIRSRRLLLTTGIVDNWPDIPGLEHCYGDTIHTCPNCDGYESRGTPCVVIGTRRKAAQVAIALMTWTNEVYICTHGHAPKFGEALEEQLESLHIPVITSPITYFEAEESKLTAIDFLERAPLACKHVFIAMGQHPANDLGNRLGCACDANGFVLVDDKHRTSVPHVYAAGDITPGWQLAMRAAAGGTEAAIAIHYSLTPRPYRPR